MTTQLRRGAYLFLALQFKDGFTGLFPVVVAGPFGLQRVLVDEREGHAAHVHIFFGLHIRRLDEFECHLVVTRFDLGFHLRLIAKHAVVCEQQRVAIARAIIARPRLLLLDEPMSNLDSELKAGLLEELINLQRSLQITTIYITHDQAEARVIAHRVVRMQAGIISKPDEARFTV